MKIILILLFLMIHDFAFSQSKSDTTKNEFYSYANVITPNNDGKQDTWQFDYIVQPDSLNLVIYNRWGNAIFESSKINFVWNGMDSKNKKIPSGIYLFKVNFYYKEQKKLFTGSITLLQ
jgi:gliding motility-associated-like protein